MPVKALVLLSGGLDSAFALVAALDAGCTVSAITFDYGQIFRAQETFAAAAIAKRYKVAVQVVALPFLASSVSHPFFGSVAPPDLKSDQLDDAKVTTASASAVWVPNRNGVFINVAAAMAEAQGADEVYVGFNREEAATFPDNSADFVSAINHSLSFSTQNGVKVVAPAAGLDKTAIVARLAKADFDFKLLWSCYRNGEKMCGSCESCQRLTRALTANGLINLKQVLF
jgi:7-cyano-7-deazaguanine synthase